MSYAIVEAGGTQLWVEPGRFYDIDRLVAEPDQAITLDRVLLVGQVDTASVGQPYVEGATVQATVMAQVRGPKILVFKSRRKKKTRKRQGHRQELTRIMIESISLNGKVIAQASNDLPVSEAEVDAD
jgi:large subunit ribosomal protein L21